jgi:hypothetical protein
MTTCLHCNKRERESVSKVKHVVSRLMSRVQAALGQHQQKFNWLELRNGCLECLKWYHSTRDESRDPWDHNILAWFVIENRIDCLKWAVEHNCSWQGDDLLFYCIKYARQEHLEYLVSKGYPMEAKHCAQAAGFDRFEMLKWFHEHRCPWDSSTTAYAAGHIRIEIGTSSCKVVHRSTECLEYAVANKCPLTSEAYARAAGCLDYQDWTTSESTPDFKMLDWLYKHNCPFDSDVANYASMYGKRSGIEWLVKHQVLKQTTKPVFTEDSAYSACYNNQADTLEYLLNSGCPIQVENCLQGAVFSGCYNTVTVLVHRYMNHPDFLTWMQTVDFKWLVHEIDFDNQVWRKFLALYKNLDEFMHAKLRACMQQKIQEIDTNYKKCDVIAKWLPRDITQHIVKSYV